MIKIFYDIRLTIQRHEHYIMIVEMVSDHYAHFVDIIIYIHSKYKNNVNM